MPSIFLSHTSVDKPFVEKLARDLKRVGINVWFDKWEIKIGDSITWKIEAGIKEKEFLGIVLSPEALASEWVKSELGAAWAKQMATKRVFVLPILHRQCDIPFFLADRRYSDFSLDYQKGLRELADALGVRDSDVINEDNWRGFANLRISGWQEYRRKEFEKLVTILVDRAIEYNWCSWASGRNPPYAITHHARTDSKTSICVSLRLDAKTHSYYASYKDTASPNSLKATDFKDYVGNTINECEEFIWRIMENFTSTYGKPTQKAYHHVFRTLHMDEQFEMSKEILKKMSWYQGANITRLG